MAKQPEFNKYLPLEAWFRARPAWLNNGWVVTEFDLQARWVKFVRAKPL